MGLAREALGLGYGPEYLASGATYHQLVEVEEFDEQDHALTDLLRDEGGPACAALFRRTADRLESGELQRGEDRLWHEVAAPAIMALA